MNKSPLRPETGIKQSLLHEYAFEDQAWNDSLHADHIKFSLLARNCVLVGDKTYILDKLTNCWSPVGQKGVLPKLLSERGGQIMIGNHIAVVTKDDIKSFLAHGLVSFAGITYAPGAGDFVIFEGQKRLNTYRDRRLVGDLDARPYTEEFLKVIRNSLCAESDENSFSDMMAEIAGSERTVFRWIMHWLAARYQRPGFAPQTNLWFIGPMRGVGKGTLVSAMKSVLGGAGKANQLDIQRGWTDSLFGNQFIEWDEFKAPGGWVETSDLIKRMTGNETFQVNTRNLGGSTHPAVAMHLFSTNDERPMRVEQFDRQNTFVATAADTHWAARAKALWDEETREFKEPRLVSGFAALLNEIEVDYAFITRPFMTAKREELVGAFQCSVRSWVEMADHSFQADDFFALDELHARYRDWVRDHLHAKPEALEDFRRKLIAGGWAKASSTTVGSRSNGTRHSQRGVRVQFPVMEEYEMSSGSAEKLRQILRSGQSISITRRSGDAGTEEPTSSSPTVAEPVSDQHEAILVETEVVPTIFEQTISKTI